ncbi:MAG: hypothetical protein IJX89_01600 [Alphaproteobacteria bacterium]|nr:hypothetical protein [Alphaproteobacteria bacterium]
MKYVISIIALFVLVACGGGDSAHKLDTSNTKSELDAIRASNREVTTLEQYTDNQVDTVAFVYNRLGLTMPNTSGSTVYSNERIGHSTTQSDRDKINIMGNLYADVVTKLQTLKSFSDDAAFNTLTNKQIIESYKIVGGTDEYNTDELSDDNKNIIRNFVENHYSDVLNKYFNYDTESGDWIWYPKTQTLADIELVNSTQDAGLIFTLNTKGKIIAVTFDTPESNVTYDRVDKNIFKNKTDNETSRATTTMFGAQYNLKYTDFGSFIVDRPITDENGAKAWENISTDFIAGGYDIKRIDKNNISGEYDFNGRAIGHVVGTDNSTISLAADATLNFDNGTETLDMKFSENNWYDVQIIRNENNDTAINFTGSDITEQFRISDNANMTNGHVDIQYYGDKNAPSEFSGTAHYADPNGIQMNTAFGGGLK